MKRKKKIQQIKNIVKNMVKPDEVSKGDFCYFISADGKTRFGAVTRVFDD